MQTAHRVTLSLFDDPWPVVDILANLLLTTGHNTLGLTMQQLT